MKILSQAMKYESISRALVVGWQCGSFDHSDHTHLFFFCCSSLFTCPPPHHSHHHYHHPPPASSPLVRYTEQKGSPSSPLDHLIAALFLISTHLSLRYGGTLLQEEQEGQGRCQQPIRHSPPGPSKQRQRTVPLAIPAAARPPQPAFSLLEQELVAAILAATQPPPGKWHTIRHILLHSSIYRP